MWFHTENMDFSLNRRFMVIEDHSWGQTTGWNMAVPTLQGPTQGHMLIGREVATDDNAVVPRHPTGKQTTSTIHELMINK